MENLNAAPNVKSNQAVQNNRKVKSITRVILMNLNIQLGSINFGYVLSYLTLSIDTLFANLGIDNEERTQKLSIINGILPVGCFVGAIVGYFLKKILTNKQCIYFADCAALLSLLATISDTSVVIAFRFFLGLANGISSSIMPVYVKSICPTEYQGQISMMTGYGLNTGLAIGQLLGIGYIYYNGQNSNWWRVVFLVPSIICIFRSAIIKFVFNYDSPEQLILKGQCNIAKNIICDIYKEEFFEEQYSRYEKMAEQLKHHNSQPFSHIFKKRNLIGLQIGVISMLVQIWCGSFAVFQYSAQIFENLSGGEIQTKTIYTFCIGLFSVLSQFLSLFMLPKLGSKNLLLLGTIMMSCVNIIIGIFSNLDEYLFEIFILLVILIMIFSCTLSPVCFSIVPQLNDSTATFLVMDCRWGFQAILIFTFPFIIKGISISGAFYLFAGIDIFYIFYICFFILDDRNKTNEELIVSYLKKYGQYEIVPQQETK